MAKIEITPLEIERLSMTLPADVLSTMSYDPSKGEIEVADVHANAVTAALTDPHLALDAEARARFIAATNSRAAEYALIYDKTGSGNTTRAVGYLLDGILGMLSVEIEAGRLKATDEITDILAKRVEVKTHNPM